MEENNELYFKDIVSKLLEYKVFLLKKKFSIIIFSFLSTLIGFAHYFISDAEYNAKLTFVVESDQAGNSFGTMSGIASQFGFDIGGSADGGTFSQNNVIELLKSRGVIVRTLNQNAKVNNKKDLLINHYIEINRIMDKSSKSEKFEEFSINNSNSYVRDSISGVVWEEIIEKNLSIDLQSKEANIITLSYISLNQNFAKEFVSRLIDEMSKMYVSHQTAQTNNTLDFLQERADSVFKELEISEQEFAKVKDINQRIVKASGRLKELQLMRRVEVLNAMYLEIVKNLELSKITLLNKTPIINIIDEPILPLKDNKMSKNASAFIGGFLGFFLSCCYFFSRKLFKDLLAVT
jgi:uncharacterized protein involved in exopolysaccharide biosynthesis